MSFKLSTAIAALKNNASGTLGQLNKAFPKLLEAIGHPESTVFKTAVIADPALKGHQILVVTAAKYRELENDKTEAVVSVTSVVMEDIVKLLPPEELSAGGIRSNKISVDTYISEVVNHHHVRPLIERAVGSMIGATINLHDVEGYSIVTLANVLDVKVDDEGQPSLDMINAFCNIYGRTMDDAELDNFMESLSGKELRVNVSAILGANNLTTTGLVVRSDVTTSISSVTRQAIGAFQNKRDLTDGAEEIISTNGYFDLVYMDPAIETGGFGLSAEPSWKNNPAFTTAFVITDVGADGDNPTIGACLAGIVLSTKATLKNTDNPNVISTFEALTESMIDPQGDRYFGNLSYADPILGSFVMNGNNGALIPAGIEDTRALAGYINAAFDFNSQRAYIDAATGFGSSSIGDLICASTDVDDKGIATDTSDSAIIMLHEACDALTGGKWTISLTEDGIKPANYQFFYPTETVLPVGSYSKSSEVRALSNLDYMSVLTAAANADPDGVSDVLIEYENIMQGGQDIVGGVRFRELLTELLAVGDIKIIAWARRHEISIDFVERLYGLLSAEVSIVQQSEQKETLGRRGKFVNQNGSRSFSGGLASSRRHAARDNEGNLGRRRF